MDMTDISTGNNLFGFFGGDTILPAFRNASGDIFSALSGHSDIPYFDGLLDGLLYENAFIGFDLNLDNVTDVTLAMQAQNSPTCGTGCNGFMPKKTPESSPIISLISLSTLGAASTLKRKLKPSKDKKLEKIS